MNNNLATKLGEVLLKSNYYLVSAESCTGGWIAEAVTAIAGSSSWFERGFVTYSNASKQELLNVKAETLMRYGAVSEQIALEMVIGALKNSHAQVGVAITGIAGPSGGSPDKPVGTVWIAYAFPQQVYAKCYYFQGNRTEIREQTVIGALETLLLELETLLRS
jgi:nicotinamide-nucleotide amidase